MNGAKCVGCANCCKEEICLLGKRVYGESAVPCPGLRYRKNRYWCHLVEVGLPADKAIKTEEGKAFGKKSISHVKSELKIGRGCPTPVNERRKNQVFKSRISHIAARLEYGIRHEMIDEYSDETQDDRDAIFGRTQRLKGEGKDFCEAIKQARLEFIENVLTEFIKEMTGANLRNKDSRKNKEGEAKNCQSQDKLPVVMGSGTGGSENVNEKPNNN